MNNNLTRLAKRREHLEAEAQAQRLALADAIDGLRKPLDMTDKGLAVLRYIRNHPILVASGSSVMLSVFRLVNIRKWFRRGWLAWKTLQRLKKNAAS